MCLPSVGALGVCLRLPPKYRNLVYMNVYSQHLMTSPLLEGVEESVLVSRGPPSLPRALPPYSSLLLPTTPSCCCLAVSAIKESAPPPPAIAFRAPGAVLGGLRGGLYRCVDST